MSVIEDVNLTFTRDTLKYEGKEGAASQLPIAALTNGAQRRTHRIATRAKHLGPNAPDDRGARLTSERR